MGIDININKNKMSGYIDFVARTLKINNLEVPIDVYGAFTIDITKLNGSKTTPIKLFEAELEAMLGFEQLKSLYKSWGNSLVIMISRTADMLEIDKSDAKRLIVMGEKYGILTTGYNNTWKFVDKVLKERFLENAKQLEELEKEQKPTLSIQDKVKASLQELYSNEEIPEKGSEIVEEEIVVPIINEKEIESPGAKLVREAQEQKLQERQKALDEVNKKHTVLSERVVKKLPVKKTVNPPVAIVTKKKPLVKKK